MTNKKDFLSELKQKLNHEDSSQFREELIHVNYKMDRVI